MSDEPRGNGKEVVITFRTEEGQLRDFAFSKRPFGIQYETGSSPVKVGVDSPVKWKHSYAESLGVKEGMQFVAIDGKDISRRSFRDFEKILKEAAEKVGPDVASASVTASKFANEVK